jgi:hypothetical protein
MLADISAVKAGVKVPVVHTSVAAFLAHTVFPLVMVAIHTAHGTLSVGVGGVMAVAHTD